jgi:hypothetical protein
MKINEQFLESYLNSNSPTGFEYELGGQKLWMANHIYYWWMHGISPTIIESWSF